MSRRSSDDWRTLVEIAHRAASSAILENCLPDLPPFPPSLSERAGAFVSLYIRGELRGCVGQLENPGPLADVVARSAINAALHDSRFSPISADEVPALKVEISVLSVPEPISPDEIIVGTHGLLVKRESCKGLLLPQVASERKWSAQRFLEETCNKAGLPRDAWRDPSTKLFGFTAEIFSEKKELPDSIC
jgi:AmmeMemoRadiSam system protein A